jgi:5-methylcytosine-specific restriction endonuclease McrBC GTP-binding regulatory subunit McrB
VSDNDLYKNYEDKGYKFTDEIITRYALSLATKPFVILSGISGTGKTKIAQLFEPLIRTHPGQEQALGTANGGINDYILMTVTEGLATGDGRANVRFDQLPAVLEATEVARIDAQIAQKVAANDNGNICAPIPLIIETPNGEELMFSLYLQRAKSPLVRLRARSKRAEDPEYDSRGYFANNHNINDVLKLEKIAPHKLKITEINGQQALREQVEQAEVAITSIDNKCFIPVKSNWTDSSELFGFYNPLTERYSLTKLLKFILLAKEHPSYPFFVILDEMNLSKVEHYFSDFLSCLESRNVNADGTVDQEGINLHSGSSFILTDDDEYEEIASMITLPLNLYVTGTVNVDDTTYMFSPKVLDRANVIEFNDVILEPLPNDSGLKLLKIPDYAEYNKSSLSMYDELSDDSKGRIRALLAILSKYNLHFGYRTISEMSHYIINSLKYIGPDPAVELASFDIQVLQKVLPKFYGNYAKLQPPIKEIIHYLSGSESEIDNFDINDIEAINLDKADFKRSLKKLIKMYEDLSSQGFSSFIE